MDKKVKVTLTTGEIVTVPIDDTIMDESLVEAALEPYRITVAGQKIEIVVTPV